MKAYLCDKCNALLPDGPLGAINFVEIEIQPSYAPVNHHHSWHLCKMCLHHLEQFLDQFLKSSDASQD